MFMVDAGVHFSIPVSVFTFVDEKKAVIGTMTTNTMVTKETVAVN